MLKNYGCYLPDEAGSVEDELMQCLEKIRGRAIEGQVAVKANFYVDSADFNSFLNTRMKCLRAIEEFFGEDCPAVNISAHPPRKPFSVAAEILFVEKGEAQVSFKSFGGFHYTLIESLSGRELWAAGVSTYSDPDDTRRSASGAFDLMISILDNENLTLNNLIRQWNYIGNILQISNGLQNYQVFNEVRSEYYGSHRSKGYYPAATGVGMKNGGVILDFCAADYSEKVRIQPVHNPQQVDAYNYGEQVLVGNNESGKLKKHPPQFERALLICNGDNGNMLVSGTASIRGQETIAKGDPGKQTRITIENISGLSSMESIRRYPECNMYSQNKYLILRVYVKEQKDFAEAVSICRELFPDTPAVFIEADICRDDLLIEVETETLYSA